MHGDDGLVCPRQPSEEPVRGQCRSEHVLDKRLKSVPKHGYALPSAAPDTARDPRPPTDSSDLANLGFQITWNGWRDLQSRAVVGRACAAKQSCIAWRPHWIVKPASRSPNRPRAVSPSLTSRSVSAGSTPISSPAGKPAAFPTTNSTYAPCATGSASAPSASPPGATLADCTSAWRRTAWRPWPCALAALQELVRRRRHCVDELGAPRAGTGARAALHQLRLQGTAIKPRDKAVDDDMLAAISANPELRRDSEVVPRSTASVRPAC